MLPDLLPGDIILSRQNNWLSKSIRWFGKRATGSARFSHAAMALGHLTEKPECIEALWKVTRSPLSKYENQEIVVYRMKNLDIGVRNEIALRAISIEQQAYGLLKIPLFALDGVFKTYFFTSHFGLSHYKVCSELAAWAYEKTFDKFKKTVLADLCKRLGKNPPFKKGWRSISPDFLDDHCSKSPYWEILYISGVA